MSERSVWQINTERGLDSFNNGVVTDMAELMSVQELELHRFFWNQADRLRRTDFDWNLPNDTKKRGLLVANFRPLEASRSGVVLTRNGNVVLIDRYGYDGGWKNSQYDLPVEMARKYVDAVERKVDKTLTRLTFGKEVAQV